ncbi:hypothetical protein K450DRAFT_228662 [Umbelopsis ramanniana AG]|uniref:RING-type domain-containing protein n=1 Tax=Umbelopsis ramanniana AG TaxID=1314678 RepID=A0AAD5HGQ2_UMBRA|nr:uncharacterized protein K450DRAFT_228662 [Umbelopsis ramanniana AG]KAI8582374.1 hypothetical protein K450DRAFT_228662 [Umbelopsis ramanniana AG]
MGYVTSFIVLLLLSTWCAEASLGEDSTSDAPSVWQYVVIALSLAFAFMTVMVCLQVARLRRRSELVEQGMRPVIHVTRSGARVYAPLPILSDDELEQIAIVDYSEENLEEQSCSICLDLFRPKTKVRLLPCRHAFHPICIECPMCKQSCVDHLRQKGLADHLQTIRNTLEPLASDSRTDATTNATTEPP